MLTVTSHPLMTQGEISERLRWIIDRFADGNQAAFGRRIGMSAAGVSRLVNGGAPGHGTLALIVIAYPSLNPYWLLTGQGVPDRKSEDERSAEDMMRNFEGMVRRMGGAGIDPDQLLLRKIDALEGVKRLYAAQGPVPGWVYDMERRIRAGEL